MPTPAAAPSPAPHHSIAFAVWAALSFSVPQMLLSLMIYPEVIAGLALVYAFRQVAIRPLPSQLWRRSLVGLAIAVLPWLNPRFVLLSGVLTLLAVIVLWRSALLASKQSPPLSAGARNDVLTSIGLLLGP